MISFQFLPPYMITSYYRISYMILIPFLSLKQKSIMNSITIGIDHSLNMLWHRSNEVRQDCRVYLAPDFLKDIVVFLNSALTLWQRTTKVSKPLVEFNLENILDIFNKIEIRRLYWLLYHLKTFILQELRDFFIFMTRSTILHKDQVILLLTRIVSLSFTPKISFTNDNKPSAKIFTYSSTPIPLYSQIMNRPNLSHIKQPQTIMLTHFDIKEGHK